jgi:F-type H+-transporting ATPase subunit c
MTRCICTERGRNFSAIFANGKDQTMDVNAAKALGAGIAVIALAGVGIGIGNIFSSLVSSVARNPAARDQVFGIGILGFALTEAVALFALLIAFLILFA